MLPKDYFLPAPQFVIDSLSIAKATPKRRHVGLKVSLTAALNEFVELGFMRSRKAPKAWPLGIWWTHP